MASVSLSEDISFSEDVYNVRGDMKTVIRISASDPKAGTISFLRAHLLPKQHSASLCPGSYLVNSTCGVEVHSVMLPAIVGFKDPGRVDELGVVWEAAPNGKMYLGTVPLPLKNGSVWVSDADQLTTNPLRLISSISMPTDEQGVKMLKSIEAWLKAGMCMRYKNVDITSMAAIKIWCNSNSFVANYKKVIHVASLLVRKTVAKEAGRKDDGKLKKGDKTAAAVELTAEESAKVEERLAEVKLVEAYFTRTAKFYNPKLDERIICVAIPSIEEEEGTLSDETLELVRRAASKKQLELIEEAVTLQKIDNLIVLGRAPDMATVTPLLSHVDAGPSESNKPVPRCGGAKGPVVQPKELFSEISEDENEEEAVMPPSKKAGKAKAAAAAVVDGEADDDDSDDSIVHASTQVEEVGGKRVRKTTDKLNLGDGKRPKSEQPATTDDAKNEAGAKKERVGRGPGGQHIKYSKQASRGDMLLAAARGATGSPILGNFGHFSLTHTHHTQHISSLYGRWRQGQSRQGQPRAHGPAAAR